MYDEPRCLTKEIRLEKYKEKMLKRLGTLWLLLKRLKYKNEISARVP